MISLELIAIGGMVASEEVHEVMLPTPQGQIAVFPNHASLITRLVPGVISVRRSQNDPDAKLEHYATNGGVAEINQNKYLRVLVDQADHSAKVVEKEAEAALLRAQQLAKDAKDQVSLDKAEQIIQTNMARLKVAELRRRHKR